MLWAALGLMGCTLPFDTSLIESDGGRGDAGDPDADVDASTPCDPPVEDVGELGPEPTPPPLPAEGERGEDPDFGSCHRVILADVADTVHPAEAPLGPFGERVLTRSVSEWTLHELETAGRTDFIVEGQAYFDDDSREVWQVSRDGDALGLCRPPVSGLRLTCEQEWALAPLLPGLPASGYALVDADPARERFIVRGGGGSAVIDLSDRGAPRVVVEHPTADARFTPTGRHHYALVGSEIVFYASDDGAEALRHAFARAPSRVWVTELPGDAIEHVVIYEEGDFLRYVRLGAETTGGELRDARVTVGERHIVPVLIAGAPPDLGLFVAAFRSCQDGGADCGPEVSEVLPRRSQLALIDARVEPPRVVPFAWHFMSHRAHPTVHTRLGASGGLASVWLNSDWGTASQELDGNLVEFIVPPHLLASPRP